MAYTQTTLDCTSETLIVSGVETVRYKLVVTVTDKGDFPDTKLLLLKIVSTTDPKADTFARVVTIPDFTEQGIDRAAAVLASIGYFRVDTHTFYFDDVDRAAAAKDVIKARIDELAEKWVVYDTEFVASSEVTNHPRPEPSAFTAAVNAHTAQAKVLATAKTTSTTAQTAYTAAKAAAASAVTAEANAKKVYDDAAKSKGWFDTLLTAMDTLYTKSNALAATGTGAGLFATKSKTFQGNAGSFFAQSTTFQAAAEVLLGQCTLTPPSDAQKTTYSSASTQFDTDQSTFTSNKATWDAALGAFDTDLATFRQDVTAAKTSKDTADANKTLFDTIVSVLLAAYTTAQTLTITADLAVATTQTTYKDALAVVAAEQSLLDAKVAGVRALKPTWTP